MGGEEPDLKKLPSRSLHQSNVDVNKATTEKQEEGGGMGSYKRVFSYTDKLGWILNGVALVAALASGTLLPLMDLVFGKFITVFNDFAIGELDPAGFRTEVNKWSLFFVYLFIARFVLTYIWTLCLSTSAMRTTKALRVAFLESTLRQDIGFFDSALSGSASVQVTTNGNLVNQGISEKLGLTVQGISTFLSAFAVAFAIQWKLTLITICIVPSILAVTGVCVGIDVQIEAKILPIYSRAGALAEEVIGSMRNVHAFWAHPILVGYYEEQLEEARKEGMKKSPNYAVLFSIEYFCVFSGYGLAFWQGIRMYSRGEIVNPGDVVTVIFAVIVAATAMTQVAPQIIHLTKAASAADELFKTIDRPSEIDPLADVGTRPNKCYGEIEVRDVKFSYPSRPDVEVLKGLSLSIPANKTTALVGASGSGKSTIIGLLERWYDPAGGKLFLDGNDISTLNVRWLRTQLRLVQQEPVLFNGTVFQNVAHGLVGTPYADSSDEEKMKFVVEACRSAYASDFIDQLPDGYYTQIGERAAMLSGGQKQRVAIARSIVSNPRILLLDEATSALDPRAERIVQEALDNVSIGRTTLVIAHKLATVKNADNIVVMSQGEVIEQGTHEELIAKGGTYARLVRAQDLGQGTVTTASDSDDEDDNAITLTTSLARPITYNSVVLGNAVGDDGETDTMGYGIFKCLFIIFGENLNLWHWFLLTVIGCFLGGLTFPALAILFARTMDAFQIQSMSDMTKEGDFYSLMFFIVAIANLVAYFILGWVANLISQALTFRYRLEMYRNVLRQDLAFFDTPRNTVGALVSKLSTQPTQLQELISFNFSLILIVVINLVSSCVLALVVGWKLGLVVVFGALPPLVGCGFPRIRLEMKLDDDTVQRFADSAALAAEAVGAVRTVSSLTLESHVLGKYRDALQGIEKRSIKSLVWTMFWFSLSQSISFLSMALGFWYGGKLLSTGEYNTTQFFVVFIGVLFSGEAAAQFFQYTTSITKGHSAANYILWLRSIKPEMAERDPVPDTFEPPTGGAANVDCKDLTFSYPQRPTTQVLKGISATIHPGQFAAFVGPSGCGKTTMIALLERFYSPTTGIITLNDVDISTICPRTYRRSLSLVSQEPTLYQGSIRSNVALGLETPASDAQIEAACKQANIWDFVSSLPEGLNTMCGSRGGQLSGGQRQRVAIARALIRQPKLLLLDEATSALDSESEEIVQAALEQAAEGRTTVAVAHRLSTVKHADCIFVFSQGVIIEQGAHAELLERRGVYYQMCLGQSLDQVV